MKQTTYTNCALDVQRDGDSIILTAGIPHAHPERGKLTVDEVFVFPMPAEYAAELGRKLSAPSVIVAQQSPIEL